MKRTLKLLAVLLALAFLFAPLELIDQASAAGYCVVTFETNGGSKVEPMYVLPGECISSPTSTKDGYELWDWYTDKACDNRFYFSNPVRSDLTLYAYWVKPVTGFTMSLSGMKKNSDGTYSLNASGMKAVFKKDSTPVKMSVSPVYTDAEFKNKLTSEPVNGVKYYFHVEIEDTEGVEGKPKVYFTDMAGGVKVSAEQAEAVFLKRVCSPGGKYATLFFEYTENVKYKVTFQTNGGSRIYPMLVARGNRLQKPTDPTRSGYAFSGWYSDKSLTRAFDFEQIITSDIVLYAGWIKNAPAPGKQPVGITTVSIEPGKKTLFLKKTGTTLQLELKVLPANADIRSVIWTCNKPKMVRVSGSGLVTALRKGKVTVKATVTDVNGKVFKAKCKLTIKKIAPKKVKLTAFKLKMKVGQRFRFEAKVLPKTAFDDTVKWSSSNKKVAAVSKDGIVTAKKKGTAIITVKAVNGKKAKIKLKVVK